MSEEARGILNSYYRCESREDRFQWEAIAANKITDSLRYFLLRGIILQAAHIARYAEMAAPLLFLT